MSERIWYQDPGHFINENNFKSFFPNRSQSFAEQLNSLMRLSIYFSLIVLLLKKDTKILFVVIFMGILTYFLYTINDKNDTTEKMFLNDKNLYRDKHSKQVCYKPTHDNPFGNVLQSDYSHNPERAPACNITRKDVKRKVNNLFEEGLYKDVGDIFSSMSSQRQFVTNPSTTIPNDQNAFAQFLYGDVNKTCKDGNGARCFANVYRNLQGGQ